MNKEIIKKGFDAAEQEHQEQQVKQIKEIVQKHLEKIAYHHEQAKEHQDKEKLLKKDLDDLKAGRLDRIEERQEKDEKAKQVRIIEVHKIVREYLPLAPWRSPWEVVWAYPSYQSGLAIYVGASTEGTITTNSTFTTLSANNTTSLGQGGNMRLTGVNCSNFASGSYQVGNNTINL